jgi:Holliday junction DNA helicase RuvB
MAEDFDLRDQHLSDADLEVEAKLRPSVFSDFDGQKKIVENLKIFVEAARLRD